MPPPASITQYIRSKAPTLLQNLQSGLSKLPVELVWATHPHWPLPPRRAPTNPNTTKSQSHAPFPNRPIRISVLDSSFNPPTLAHLALANSPRPKYSNEDSNADEKYDAKLLLLSVKNVDKRLKPGDASYVQRLEMMGLLAQDVDTKTVPTSPELSVADGLQNLAQDHNVAIAVIDEPTFVGKSKVLTEYLRNRIASLTEQASGDSNSETSSGAHYDSSNGRTTQPQLTFIIGLDTLERLFSPRYYAPSNQSTESTMSDADPAAAAEQNMISSLTHMLSPPSAGGDDSLIVCARRTSTLSSDISSATSPDPNPRKNEMDWGLKLGFMKPPESESPSTESQSESKTILSESAAGQKGTGDAFPIPKDERIVMIDIGTRASKFSSTAVRNARARVGHTGRDDGGGGPWREWVTKGVAGYVESEGLYLS